MSTCNAPRAQPTRQLADRDYRPPLPETPTAALPGSDEKVDILIARAHSGKGLWHPSDRKWTDPVAEQTEKPEKPKVERFVFALTLNDLFQG